MGRVAVTLRSRDSKRELFKESDPPDVHVIQVFLAIDKFQGLLVCVQNKLSLH